MSSDGPLAAGTLAASKRGGLNAEHGAVDRVDGLEPVSDEVAEHYDAVAENLVLPSDIPMAGICLLEVGTKVEIKSVMVVYGEAQRRGRYKLRRNQHEALVDEGGVYCFVVCEPRPKRPIIAMKIVPATSVGGLVDSCASWRDEDDGRGPKAQFAWSRVFDPEEIDGGESR